LKERTDEKIDLIEAQRPDEGDRVARHRLDRAWCGASLYVALDITA